MSKSQARIADPLGWPDFTAPLLRAIVDAFIRRRRAIRAHGSLECERAFSETGEGRFERLNIDFDNELQLRLTVWDDGAMWLRACAPRPGRNQSWAFLHRFHGDIGSTPADELVRLFEQTLLLCGSEGDCSERLRALWHVVGPRDRP